MSRLLVIDDDRSVLHLVRAALSAEHLEVLSAETSATGLQLMQAEHPDVVLLDIILPHISGLETFRRIRDIDPKIPIIFMTAEGSSETAIEAMKLGAIDFLIKPLDVSRVRALVFQALEIRQRMCVAALPPAPILAGGEELLGRSPQMVEVYKAIGRVAPKDVAVLIRGESGTGKELVAHAIHHHSSRHSKPFMAVNCAAIPDSLLESELFGHERGAFTGAEHRRIGRFEQCHGGTIFLDEVGDMSPLLQSKLLRVLQEQRFERVGGNETISTNVRIITATNCNLESMTESGAFRADLFYRLNGFALFLPPLRERGEDIPLLINWFLRRYARELGKEVQGLTPEALDRLVQYPWPGNIRELQSVLRKGLLNAASPMLSVEHLPEEVRDGATRPKRHFLADEGSEESDLASYFEERLHAHSSSLYAESLAFMERFVLTRVLQLTSGNQSRAAEILGITRGSLRNKIHALNIAIEQTVHVEK